MLAVTRKNNYLRNEKYLSTRADARAHDPCEDHTQGAQEEAEAAVVDREFYFHDSIGSMSCLFVTNQLDIALVSACNGVLLLDLD